MTPPPAEQFAARVFLGPTLRAQPDRRLVDLVRDGYDAAFEEIVRRYRRPLDRFATAIVGGRSEDVTQDAFSKALLALRGSEAEIELRPWLYRIVRNTALNDLRDRGPAAEELLEALPGARSAAAEAETRQELRELMERLRALPEPQRAALVMRELEGLSHEEIAAALGVSGGAARQAIYRARAALREGFGLLVPMPVLRALADHGGEAVGAGAAAGALKVGLATVLVAGTVGAGVAIDHHHGGGAGPEAAEAAPLEAGAGGARRAAGDNGDGAGSSSGTHDRGDGVGSRAGERGDDSGASGSLGDGDRSGSNSGSGVSGGRSGHSGQDSGGGSGGGGSGGNSGPGSISGGHHSGDDDGGDDHGGSSGADDDGSGDDGGSSGPGSGDDGSSGGGEGGGSSGPGGGETEEPVTTVPEPEVVDGTDSSGEGSGTGGESGSGGSGDGDALSLDG